MSQLFVSLSSPDRRWKLLIGLAVGAYGLLASLLIAQRPGLQYDESLLALGAVHMRHSADELRLPHDPDTWVCLFGRCPPLITVRYVGALKEYLCLPFFVLFGPGADLLRGISAALGAIGLVGMAALTRGIAGPGASAWVTFAIAVNPSYVDLTVFENGAVAGWMAALGCAGVAVSRYWNTPSARAAAWCGAAFGLGLWARVVLRGSHAAPRRAAAIVTVALAAFLFLSRLPIAEHHFIVLLPFGVLVTVLALGEIWFRTALGKILVAGFCCAYAASVTYWNLAAIRGLRGTGGTGQWSDAIFKLADLLESSYAGREILILDWGLQNSL